MLKLTKTGIGLLTKQYRSVLRKCLLLNLGIFALTATNTIIQQNAYALTEGNASGGRATAVGIDSIATAQSSSSFGDNAKAYGYHALSLGAGSRVDNSLSVALGAFSSTSEDYVISVGHKSTDLSWNGSLWGADLFRRIVNVADGINAHDAVTLGQMNNALNYYYTFRVDESEEVTDSASFFQKDFSTLQEVDLHIKNPTHLGAFAKCDEVCPRPSERFSLSLSQEQMFKNNASVDAGTSRHCLRQFGDVVANLLKNTVAKGLRMYEFMNEEVCHA